MKHISLLLTALIMLGACRSPLSSEKSVTEESRNQWQVALNVSGGFAGLQRQLTIDNSGAFAASDRRAGTIRGKLKTEQLTQLDELLGTLEGAITPQSRPSFPGGCADCLMSRLDVSFNGRHYSVTLRSGEVATPPYADLFAQLSMLMRETFKNP